MEDGYRKISRPTAIYALETVRHEERARPQGHFFARDSRMSVQQNRLCAHTRKQP